MGNRPQNVEQFRIALSIFRVSALTIQRTRGVQALMLRGLRRHHLADYLADRRGELGPSGRRSMSPQLQALFLFQVPLPPPVSLHVEVRYRGIPCGITGWKEKVQGIPRKHKQP